MSSKSVKKGKLSREILGVFGVSAAIAVFFFGFLSITGDSIVQVYCEKQDILLSEMMEWMVHSWIQSVSFLSAAVLFVFLFLFLVGQKIRYIQDITRGIEALRTHRLDYEITLEGDNELTKLAESINYLAKTERELQRKEALMREEKEGLIRALSHDIRTPLTSILSYSEYMQDKEDISCQEMEEYVCLMRQKAQQIKALADRLLHGGRTLEKFENGRLLMEQLVDEWETNLEDSFVCQIDLEACPAFAGEFDVQELQRIFDNLASNIRKYADTASPVQLRIYEKEKILHVEQSNVCRKEVKVVESNGIGLESIRKIVALYGGSTQVESSSEFFRITFGFPLEM